MKNKITSAEYQQLSNAAKSNYTRFSGSEEVSYILTDLSESNAPEREEQIKDASHYKILGNLPGKEQDGINPDLLDLWGECENFYGDPHKVETGRQLLKRLETIYTVSKIKDTPAIDAELKLRADRFVKLNKDTNIRSAYIAGANDERVFSIPAIDEAVKVEKGLTSVEQSETAEKMAERYASWFGIYNDPEWNKLRLAFLAGERLGRLKSGAQWQQSQKADGWVSMLIEPNVDDYYQLAHFEDVYLDFFKYRPKGIDGNAFAYFRSVNDNQTMDIQNEVSHYKKINIDAPLPSPPTI